MALEHCGECAGYGYYQTAECHSQGYIQCISCKGHPTRDPGPDWDPVTRRIITEAYRSLVKCGYEWHFACESCGARFLSGVGYAQLKKRAQIPCCGDPQPIVHSQHAKPCDCRPVGQWKRS